MSEAASASLRRDSTEGRGTAIGAETRLSAMALRSQTITPEPMDAAQVSTGAVSTSHHLHRKGACAAALPFAEVSWP